MADAPAAERPAPTLPSDGDPLRRDRVPGSAEPPGRRMWLRTLAAVIAIGGLMATACSKGSGSSERSGPAPAEPAANNASPTTLPAPAGPVTITFANQSIDHPTQSVPAGTTVTWTNAETNGVPHNVTSGTVQGTTGQPDGKFASTSLFNPGEKYEHTFTAPGTYHYYCSVHLAQMQGTITVG